MTFRILSRRGAGRGLRKCPCRLVEEVSKAKCTRASWPPAGGAVSALSGGGALLSASALLGGSALLRGSALLSASALLGENKKNQNVGAGRLNFQIHPGMIELPHYISPGNVYVKMENEIVKL